MQCRFLRLPNLYPTTNASQFFDGDSLVGALSLFDNALADYMICMASKTAFFARQFFETTTAGLRTFGLKFGTQFAMAKTNIFRRLSLIGFSIAINRDIDNAHINSKKAVNVAWFWRFHLASSKQIELAVNQAQVGLASLPLQQFQLALSTDKRKAQTTIDRPYTYFFLVNEPTQNPSIVGNAAAWLESAFAAFVEFVSIGNFAYCTHDHLSGQVSGFTNKDVNQLVQVELGERATFPSNLTDFVAGCIGGFQSGKQGLVLLWRCLKFDLGGKFHRLSITYFLNSVKHLTKRVVI